MKQFTILVLFLASVLLNGQSKKTKESCILKMTKEVVLSLDFNTVDCLKLEDKKILHFKFKVPNYATAYIKGNALSNEAKSYISKASVGDVIAVFDIMLESEEKMPPVLITLIE
jgi:hypothetical protein